jgi:hypothetical protein
VAAVMLLGAMLFMGGSVSCGPRMMYKSTVHVGTTNPQTAFYAALMAVNTYRYPFEAVDASAGMVRTGQIQLGHGNWFQLVIQVQPHGEVLIDPVTNMERSNPNGVLVPRGIVSRANNVARLISRFVTQKSEEQIVLEGETLHQQILAGLASGGAAVVASPVAGTAVPLAPGAEPSSAVEGVALPAE